MCFNTPSGHAKDSWENRMEQETNHKEKKQPGINQIQVKKL
jgi:hypothetical protein